MRLRSIRTYLVAFLAAVGLVAGAAAATPATAAVTRPAPTPSTLVLYDSTGQWGWLGEMYAQQVANLASHFGTWKAMPVTSYTSRAMDAYTGVVYLGSTYDEPLPTAFLDDVLANRRPVIWAQNNLWRLAARSPDFAAAYGFTPGFYDTSTVTGVQYKGQTLTRSKDAAGGILGVNGLDAARVSVLATAVRADGSTMPWAVRSGTLTFLSEIPFSYVSEGDRYLIFSDLLFDLLAPQTVERHRAMVRLEDLSPMSDPTDLRAIGNYLGNQRIPFSFGIIPVYKDPAGVENDGVPETVRLRDRPQVVSAIKFLISQGGTPILHGYTHQFGELKNPYDGVTGNDFEFFLAHEDSEGYVRYDGPVPGDSKTWADGRITDALREVRLAGLPTPTIFEFPHYAASPADYAAVNNSFTTRYERGLYFGGLLTGKVDTTRLNGQFFPYVVKDIYGATVLPENLGNVDEEYNHHPERTPADLVGSAQKNLVIRDGFASFFYHPYLGVVGLKQTVDGIRDLGYTFVSPANAR